MNLLRVIVQRGIDRGELQPTIDLEMVVMVLMATIEADAAESFANITTATLDETFPALNSIKQGATSLLDYLSQLVRSGGRKYDA